MPAQRALVIGAGLSGLACAFDLARAGVDVTVLERSRRAGGVVGTFELDGFRFETGPTTIQASSAELRQLCADLGIAERLIVSRREARERYLWLDDRLRALPGTPGALLTSPILSFASKLRVASELFRRFEPPRDRSEPTLRAFFEERLGREAATRLAGAFVRGVYAAELDELGARSAFPRMWSACVEHGGLLRGALAARKREKPVLPGPACSSSDLLSFEEGLGALVAALERALGPRLALGVEAHALERDEGGGWHVTDSEGGERSAEHVVLATPAPVASRLLARVLPAHAERLARIDHARVTLVHLGFASAELAPFPKGFGYLVPPEAHARRAGERRSVRPRVLGTIFGSNLFDGRAPEDHIAVTSFYSSAAVAEGRDDDVASEAARDLALALGLERTPAPRVARAQSWSDVIPRYAPGHRDAVDALEHDLAASARGLHVAGSWVAGVSVEQVIARGRTVARRVTGGGA